MTSTVTFVKLACINGVFSYTVTTRALVTSVGGSFKGTYNLDIRDAHNNAVIPGGLNGGITGNTIAAITSRKRVRSREEAQFARLYAPSRRIMIL